MKIFIRSIAAILGFALLICCFAACSHTDDTTLNNGSADQSNPSGNGEGDSTVVAPSYNDVESVSYGFDAFSNSFVRTEYNSHGMLLGSIILDSRTLVEDPSRAEESRVFVYTENGRLDKIFLGNYIFEIEYASNGLCAEGVDVAKIKDDIASVSLTFNEKGIVLSEKYYIGADRSECVRSYEYDQNGTLTVQEEQNGKLRAELEKNNGVLTINSYLKENGANTSQDVYSFEFNENGSPKKLDSLSGGEYVWGYDDRGILISSSGNGEQTTVSHDVNGRVSVAFCSAETESARTKKTYIYTYGDKDELSALSLETLSENKNESGQLEFDFKTRETYELTYASERVISSLKNTYEELPEDGEVTYKEISVFTNAFKLSVVLTDSFEEEDIDGATAVHTIKVDTYDENGDISAVTVLGYTADKKLLVRGIVSNVYSNGELNSSREEFEHYTDSNGEYKGYLARKTTITTEYGEGDSVTVSMSMLTYDEQGNIIVSEEIQS